MPSVARHGARISYEITDLRAPWVTDSQTIIFHHGVCATGDLWDRWLPYLIDRYRIVRFDMRGYGGSSVSGLFEPTLADLIADVLAVANASGASNFHLVGESIGGTIALAAALERPDGLKSVTVTNAAAHGGRLENVRIWRELMREHGQAGWAEQMMAWRFFPDALDKPAWDWFYEQHATCSMDVTLYLAELLLGADLRKELPSVTCPMLVLSPDSSPFIPIELMAEIFRAVPRAEMQVVPHSKHGLPLSHSGVCASALRDFLERCSIRGDA